MLKTFENLKSMTGLGMGKGDYRSLFDGFAILFGWVCKEFAQWCAHQRQSKRTFYFGNMLHTRLRLDISSICPPFRGERHYRSSQSWEQHERPFLFLYTSMRHSLENRRFMGGAEFCALRSACKYREDTMKHREPMSAKKTDGYNAICSDSAELRSYRFLSQSARNPTSTGLVASPKK